MSANPISYLEIDAYCRLMSVELSQFELDAIKQLDIVSMNAATKPLKQTKIGKKEK